MRQIVLIRHGQTEWSAVGRHTSVTDLQLTPDGERRASALGARLAGLTDNETDDDLAEWNYGEYEGLTTQQIQQRNPGWSIWTGHTPGGESADLVGARADRVLARLRPILPTADACLVGHGHMLRVLVARWLGLPPRDGSLFQLDTATLSVLGYERETPVLSAWNT